MASISPTIPIDLKDIVDSNCSLHLNFDCSEIELFTQTSYHELIKDCMGIAYVLAIVPVIVKNTFKTFYYRCDGDSLLRFTGKNWPNARDKITSIFWYVLNGQTFNYLGNRSDLRIPEKLPPEKEKLLNDRKEFLEAYIHSSSPEPKRALAGLNNLGVCYRKDIGVDRSSVEKKEECNRLAFECFNKAAAHQLPEAIYNLGCCYQEGVGVNRSSLEKERECDRLAAECFHKARELQNQR